MQNNSRVHFIPAAPPRREKRVGIYARVSTNSAEQLQSLTTHVESVVLIERK